MILKRSTSGHRAGRSAPLAQRELLREDGIGADLAAVATDDGLFAMMQPDEIDKLCENLNADGSAEKLEDILARAREIKVGGCADPDKVESIIDTARHLLAPSNPSPHTR